MTAAPLFDTFIAMFAIDLLISIGTLVMFLVVSFSDDRRSTLPRAIVRLP